MDWKDALSGLLPDDYTPEPEAAPADEKPTQRGKLTVQIERKGRAGKTATIVSGFTLADDEVSRIASQLKQKLGKGGSARGGEILIQGDCREAVVDALRAMGFKS